MGKVCNLLPPQNCAEGEECDAEAADAGSGNPCRPAAGAEGYERK